MENSLNSVASQWIEKTRSDFPILMEKINGQPLVYLDSAASAQKPRTVIERMNRYYQKENANIHRGVYFLSEQATEAYEGVREKVLEFMGLPGVSKGGKTHEVVFTSGTTDSINRVAQCWGVPHLKKSQSIVVSAMEHHSNYVPWQQLALRLGCSFEIVELDSDGRINLESYDRAMKTNPGIVSITLMSNFSGVINPISELAKKARAAGAKFCVDAAQGAPHGLCNMQFLGPDVDFVAFSAHKIFGPTGSGVLWAKEARWLEMQPTQFGGDMISDVQDRATSFNDLPWRFEAGTPNIASVIGMGEALDYLKSLTWEKIEAAESAVGRYAMACLKGIPGLKLFGPQEFQARGPVFSFVLEGIHPGDLASYLDQMGIAIRVGHHCVQPLLRRLDVTSTARASFAFYNNQEDVDRLVGGILRAQSFFGKRH
jgi:cysteine desulfurase/selenocysteine lyase